MAPRKNKKEGEATQTEAPEPVVDEEGKVIETLIGEKEVKPKKARAKSKLEDKQPKQPKQPKVSKKKQKEEKKADDQEPVAEGGEIAAKEDPSTINESAAHSKKSSRKVRKTNEGTDIGEEKKKQSIGRRNKSKAVSVSNVDKQPKQYKEDDSDDGQDVAGDSSDEELKAIIKATEVQDEAGSEKSSDEDGEASDGEPKKQKVKESKNLGKKRSRDGKIKPQPKEKGVEKKKEKDKGDKGGKPLEMGHKTGKDEGKIMMTEPEAKTGVKEYMIKNVMDNMHGRIHKKICEKVLNDLTSEKFLTMKEFGKAKIYLSNQDNYPATDNKELDKLDVEIKELKDTLQKHQQELKETQIKLKDVTGGLNNDQLTAEIERLKIENSSLKERTAYYEKGDVQMISEQDVNEAKKGLLKYGNEWKKRKRGCMDIIDQICESADLNKKDFLVSSCSLRLLQKKIGLELDEDFKVNVNDILTI